MQSDQKFSNDWTTVTSGPVNGIIGKLPVECLSYGLAYCNAWCITPWGYTIFLAGDDGYTPGGYTRKFGFHDFRYSYILSPF